MKGTYKAVEVSAPGVLRLVERPVSEPAAGQVRIRVEACGVCHTDASTITGTYPGLQLPRVPGHEVVGRIEALGSGVSRWKIGQRVGVGFFGGEDGTCEPCRRGDMVNCLNAVVPGVTMDGGYAEVMIAEARGLAAIPDELGSAEAAPLLCAGITTYNALRNAGLRGGDLSRCKASADWGIWECSLRGTWDFIRWPSGVDATRKSSRKNWARTFTLILPRKMPPRYFSAWVGRERFSRQLPAVTGWDRLCPASRLAVSSSWWVCRSTRFN